LDQNVDLKNNFKKIKKYYFDTFQHEKHFEKQSQPHSQAGLYLFIFFIHNKIIILSLNSKLASLITKLPLKGENIELASKRFFSISILIF
jgi:hypothetical protein